VATTASFAELLLGHLGVAVQAIETSNGKEKVSGTVFS
jgi:hypothetical protein